MLISEAVCGEHRPARPSAAAIELIHNFSLIHDDVEDRSPTRRGRPTVWKIWGEAQAINAGDTMFSLAHMAIPQLTPPDGDAAKTLALLKILGETCLELTRGQHLDMAFETADDIHPDGYINMIEGKTAALIAAAGQMGALAGGADDARQEHYKQFGRNLGLAFQIIDDILDIWGLPEKTGKQAAVDIHQRKKSLPVLYGLERSEALRALYRQEEAFDLADVERAVKLLGETGAEEYSRDLAMQYSVATAAALEHAGPDGEAGENLLKIVEMLLHRDY